MTRYLKIENCSECPHRQMEPTYGAGFAVDWLCARTPRPSKQEPHPNAPGARLIAGYIEYPSEEPEKIPKWCPLPTSRYRSPPRSKK